jgi:hypothetical protein
MKRTRAISVTALGVAALVGTTGCTRTSDGSIVLKTPSFGRVLGFDSALGFGGNEGARFFRRVPRRRWR